MPPRANNAITVMIAQARQKLEEIKSLQFFGGDSLNLSMFEQLFTAPPPPSGVQYYAWLVTMTPTKPDVTMPLDTQSGPGAENTFNSANVERIPTTDGTFKWLVYTSNFSGDFPPIVTRFAVIYSGTANFDVQVIA